jgi:small subunit ribosomal protein S16
MLSIRLQRVGRKHNPSFRIVATNSRNGPKTNKHRAILGSYDAIQKTTIINDPEEVQKYLSYGAHVTDTVHNILVSQGIIEGAKKNVLPKKSPIVDEEALAREAEEKAAAEVPAEEEVAEVEAASESEEDAAEATEDTEQAKESAQEVEEEKDTQEESETAEEDSQEESEDAPAEEATEEEKKES